MNRRTGDWHTIGAMMLALILATAPVHANDLSINGFFTVDASISRGGNSGFPGSTKFVELEQDKPNFDNSLVGVQADYEVNADLQLTLQGIVGKNRDDRYAPSIEWAYLNYDAGDDLHLRAGQFKPVFLQGTELRNVGYSRVWVRPLLPTDGTAGFRTYLGGEFIKYTAIGDYSLSLQGGAGVADHIEPTVKNHDIEIFSATLDKDGPWLKLAAFRAQSDYSPPGGTGPLTNSAVAHGSSVEAELPIGALLVNLGLVDVENEQGPDVQMSYLSLGYHVGRITPYLLYRRQTQAFRASSLPPPPGSPPPVVGTETAITSSAGLRLELAPGYAIKAQVSRIDRTSTTNVENDTLVYTLLLEGVF